MPARINKGLEDISMEDVLRVFRIFCEVYGIKVSKQDVRFMQEQAIDHLSSRWGLDYRPFMGAKFFGQAYSGFSEFHGYDDTREYDTEEKSQEFQRRLSEEFGG